MSEEKSNFWNMGQRTPAGQEKVEAQDDVGSDEIGVLGETTKASAQFDVLQIASAERFQCVFKNGQKMRVCCWVTLRHRTTGEVVITGAVSNTGSKGRMTLAIDIPDADRFGAV